ncbi:RNA polymerase ECF family sigma subunit [Glaciihabitans tibetensis]|uniref:RNA polymerase ECF family sigma subunit n=1 Tax=Glaciihabitans tibetensis TaxID=1266600 RepID=A0A2T0VCP1_9MICO|nr:sigma-70 family RNA polymerase sigma factor [Glaciihabitans tibetensis]PRY67941.1 RNA polymerase ECF family sigma subunit [Glaciihabitans tibetensis]
MNGAGDERLVAAAVRGDERAFAVLYDLHVDQVYSQAMAELQNPDDAQEVTQEVFAIAWRRRAKVQLVDGSALTWLLTTCRNVTANHLRAQRRRPVIGLIEERPPTLADTDRVEEQVDSRRLMERMERAVMAMPDLDREVYRAIIHRELSYEQTAAALGISVASVRKRLNRVRTRLRKSVGGEL